MDTINRPRAKRYGWFRMFNDFSGHQLWRLVSAESGVSLAEVEALVVRILVCANKGKPRGSISAFSCKRAAADLAMAHSEVLQVYQALEQNGWIDQEYLSQWDDRQPDKEDPTNSIRQARYKSRRRQERGIVEEFSAAGNTVTSVTVTPKTKTQTAKKTAPVTSLTTGQTVTWKDVQEAGYVVPRQRSLPLPPVPLTKKGVSR